MRIDGGAHRVGTGGERIEAGNRSGLAGDLVDEMETDVAAWPFELHHGRQGGRSPAGFLDALPGPNPGPKHPGLPHPVEHVGEPLLRARAADRD
jgi:hypothetical protein